MIRLERVDVGDGTVDADLTQRNFDRLQQLVIDPGGRSLGFRIGAGQLTFTAGSRTNESVFTHGLGKTPVAMFVTANTFGQGAVVAMHAGNYTATSFKAMAEFVNGFAPGAGAPIDFVWLAIG